MHFILNIRKYAKNKNIAIYFNIKLFGDITDNSSNQKFQIKHINAYKF